MESTWKPYTMRRSLVDTTNRPLSQRLPIDDIKLNHINKNANYTVTKADNATLNRYFTDYVQVEKEKTTRIREEVLPNLDAILDYVHSRDRHFGKKGVRVGSSTQGLNVDVDGDVDCSVVFEFITKEDEEYFANHVGLQVEKEKTTWKGEEEALYYMDTAIACINSLHKYDGEMGVGVGSSTHGLNVSIKGKKYEDHPPNKLSWGNFSDWKPRFYGFEDQAQNDTSSLSDDLKIVTTQYPLRYPQAGYCIIDGFSDLNPGYSGLSEFVFNGDLIPFPVKRKFKRLLLEALKELQLGDDMKLSKIIHGPALTFKAEVTMSDGETHKVGIDLAVIIRAKLPFLPKMNWPVTGRPWPPQDKIQSIQKIGINVVAKKAFYWQLSFAELEKELVREIDKDGGCRKIVHRIMKSVYYTVCKEKPALSSYILKNVWFLECEKYPNTESWQPENLAERYYVCLESLRESANQGWLPQYFNRRVNLLKDKDVGADVEKIIRFDFMRAVSLKREAENIADLQPHPKMAKILSRDLL